MSNGFPQYAKSIDPGVIKAVEQILEGWGRFTDAAQRISLEYTGEENRSVYSGSQIGGAVVSGLVVRSKDEYDALPGQWKKWYGPGFQYPYRSNPIAKEWEAERYKAPEIPDRPSLASGNGWLGRGAVFLYEGAAYSGHDFQPEHGGEGGLWEEIKASEWHAAKEAYEESQKVSS